MPDAPPHSTDGGAGARPSNVDVAIIGGGIGGLAAAVALRRAGFDAHVFERTAVLREVGGVVVLRDPSLRLLEAWELQAVYDDAVPLAVVELRDGCSAALIRTSSTDFIGDGACYATHRADVHDLLRSAVPSKVIHLGLAAEHATNDDGGDRATVHFADGSQIRARVVVGADGIRSAVRRAVCDDEPIFQGAVAIRTACAASALSSEFPNDRARMWAHGSRMILTLPMKAMTLVAVDAILDGAGGELTDEDPWETVVSKDRLLERYADFHPDVVGLIRSGTLPARAHPVYDRDPIDRWANGRIVLLGDAAHPMTPRQGQGANQAIQDAGALAEELARSGLADPADGLTGYQRRRVGPATALQRASRETPEQLYASESR